jgi:hypothetical protein
MKSKLFAAASCINVGVVVDEFVFVGLHSLEDFLPLYHAHFTVHYVFADFMQLSLSP